MENRMSQWVEQYEASLDPFLFSILSLVLLLVLIFRFNRALTNKLNIPPSPSRLPIIGNLHQLGSLPHRTLRSLAQKHGPLMLLHLGQNPTLVVSSAEGAKEILKTQDVSFADRPKTSVAQRLLYDKDVTFSCYNEYWRQTRKICVLQLLSAQRVESFKSIREEESTIVIEKIRQFASSSSVVNVSEMIFSYINDATCRVVLGRKFRGEDGSGRKFWKMIAEFLYLLGVFNFKDLVPWLAWVDSVDGHNKRVENNFKELDSFLQGVIEEHKQCRKTDEGVEDLVDVLVGIEKEGSIGVPFAGDNMKAIILDIFSAGTDTIAVTLIWAMTELIKQPDAMKEVQRGVREIGKGKQYITEDELGEMHCLKLVIKETLRLHPPAPLLVPRESNKSTKVQGYDIPAKARVVVNAFAIGRDPEVWEEPDEFRPKRFLNKSVDYRGVDFEMIPFGGGRRGCPGVLFAIPNMELPLANLLFHFDWALPSGEDVDLVESPGIIIRKASPLLLLATPRRFE